MWDHDPTDQTPIYFWDRIQKYEKSPNRQIYRVITYDTVILKIIDQSTEEEVESIVGGVGFWKTEKYFYPGRSIGWEEHLSYGA